MARGAGTISCSFPPNFGWSDVGCCGHPSIRTPNLDRMAAEGVKFTQWHSAAPVCTPGRAALLTGGDAVRSGLTRVLFPDSAAGISAGETTLAEVLKGAGHQTAAIGRWHLGHLPQSLPTRHGFNPYRGIPPRTKGGCWPAPARRAWRNIRRCR